MTGDGGADLVVGTPGEAIPGQPAAGVVTLTGLAPATAYEYRLAADCVVDPLSTGAFRTLSAPANTGRVTFAFGADLTVGGVVPVSGDQHWSGVLRNTSFAPYAFYEFMPTPLMAFFRAPPTTTDPQILFETGNRDVYAGFDIDATVSPPRLTVEYLDTTTNASLYRLTLTPNDISPP